LKQYFSEIFEYRYVLISLVKRDLMGKYRRSRLGVLWSVLTPLGLAAVVGGVYGILFGTSPQTLIPMIFAGLNPWVFMSGTADNATMTFTAAESYIKQSTVTTYIFPLRTVLTNFLTLSYSILAFFCVYLFFQPNLFGPKMLMCIPGLLIMYFFSWGLANITSVINMNFRDFAPMQSLILQGFFYATPIIYDAQILKDRGYQFVYLINPFYYMLEVVRKPMLGYIPGWRCYVAAVGVAAAVFLVGAFVQIRNRKKIVYLL